MRLCLFDSGGGSKVTCEMPCWIDLEKLASFLLINREENQLNSIGSTGGLLSVKLSYVSGVLGQNVPCDLSPIFL